MLGSVQLPVTAEAGVISAWAQCMITDEAPEGGAADHPAGVSPLLIVTGEAVQGRIMIGQERRL